MHFLEPTIPTMVFSSCKTTEKSASKASFEVCKFATPFSSLKKNPPLIQSLPVCM